MYLFFWKFPWSCDHGGCESWLVFTSIKPSRGNPLFSFVLVSEINEMNSHTNAAAITSAVPLTEGALLYANLAVGKRSSKLNIL